MTRVFFSLFAAAGLIAMGSKPLETAALCTIAPARALLLLEVESDTLLPHVDVAGAWRSASSVRPGPEDSLLAVEGTPMAAGRVRLLRMDDSTRGTLTRAGITDPHPVAFVRAAPYRADCRTIRWKDSVRWLARGDTGYARATLAPRPQWIGGTPVFIIRPTWSYPYPRQRGLAYGVPRERALASADAMYSLNATLESASPLRHELVIDGDTALRRRVLEWTRSHLADAELEPIRTLVRRAVLAADWQAARRLPSRLRGSYQVTMESDGSRGTWYFRTHDRVGSSWPEAEPESTAHLLASPHVFGYRLMGYAAPTREALVSSSPRLVPDLPMVWLAAEDRPTVDGNEARTVLRGELMFRMGGAPNPLWDVLDMYVPPHAPTPTDSLLRSRSPYLFTRENRQPRLPMTIRLDGAGGVRADTTLTMNGKTLRVSLTRLDTVAVARPF